ncbi:glycosyltransferase family 9 protein [Motilibacter sp. K478]|nr:glycosyltransferase family 9 protein [Motilibacter aurantiacus]
MTPRLPPRAGLGPLVPDVQRLAVLRSGGLGDLVGAEPAVAALRAAYPDAEITLLGAEQMRPLVEGRPGPWDRFEAVPLVPGVRGGAGPDASPEEVERWAAARREDAFDLAVQLHGGGGNANPLLRRVGARVTAGPAAPDAPKLDVTVPWTPFQPDALRWLEVAAALGAPPLRLTPRLSVTEEDRAAAASALAGLPAGRPLAALHLGASDPRRCWPAEKFAAVADALADAGATVLVVGSAADAGRADRLLAAASHSGSVVPLVGRVGLDGLLGALERCALLVGNDSGPRHLAAAIGTPTVGVFTSANLVDVAPLARAWHRVAVSWTPRCARCGRGYLQGDCGHGETALDDVRAEEVVGLALELWEQSLATP